MSINGLVRAMVGKLLVAAVATLMAMATTGCATTGATFQSGVGDRFLEHPPWYAGRDVAVTGVGGRFGGRQPGAGAGRPSRQTWTAVYSGHVEEEWKGPIQVIVGLHAKLDADGSAKIVAIPPPCSRWLLPDRPSYVEAVLSAVAGRPSRPGRFSDSTNNRFHQP